MCLFTHTALARFSYKLCEIRPPSIEKFLETNRLNLDSSAPPVIYPGSDFRAPFDSRNTVFARDAFWSLLLLPEPGTDYVALHEEELASEEEVYLLRSVIAQQMLGEFGGSTKFSVALQKADRFINCIIIDKVPIQAVKPNDYSWLVAMFCHSSAVEIFYCFKRLQCAVQSIIFSLSF